MLIGSAAIGAASRTNDWRDTLARYGKGHKEETHERIVRLAAERFRKDGIDGVGVASLMADAGLTHGGFYAHFSSKESLVREAMIHAFAHFPKEFVGHNEAPKDLGALIDWYLSPSHRDRPAMGCPMAALGPDLARRPKMVRGIIADGRQAAMSKICAGLAADLSESQRRALAYSVMSQMLGALQLARVTAADKAFSAEVLSDGRRVARQLAGLDAPADPGQLSALTVQ